MAARPAWLPIVFQAQDARLEPKNGYGKIVGGFGSGSTLTQADITALNNQSQAPHIVTAIPITQAAGNMTYQNQNWFAQTTGSTADYAQVRAYTMASGSFFTSADVQKASKIAKKVAASYTPPKG